MHDVRQAGFKVHKLARECEDEIKKFFLVKSIIDLIQ